jgi:hypothetical protein
MSPGPTMAYRYQADENPKRKHHWSHPEPGFDQRLRNGRQEQIGKCPNTLDLTTAETLLSTGVYWSPEGWEETHPKRIYVVYNGWVYRAVVTNPGVSYHAFPEAFDGLPKSRPLREALASRAAGLGCLEGVQRWLKS